MARRDSAALERWRRQAIRRLTEVRRSTIAFIAGLPEAEVHWFESMADADRFNARSVARTRRLGVAALMRRMAHARAELIEHLEHLPPDALDDPSHAYTVVDWLPEPGWTHEEEHLAELRAWWRKRRGELARPARKAG